MHLPVTELDARRLASLIDGVLIEDAAAPVAPVPGDAESVPLPVSELDARRLASLINDVLIEEARRHGVDLS